MKHPTPEDFDHARDLRKHDSEPARIVPLFTEGNIPTAFQIAALCCGIPVDAAAKLIEQYATTKASAAALEEAQRIYARLDRCTQ